MGLFGNKKSRDPFVNVVSVVLIETTQLYGTKNTWGLNFSSNPLGDPFVTSQNVPQGTELKFSVTYKDGFSRIIKARSGTKLADRLLQMAYDPHLKQDSSASEEKTGDGLIQLQKNQLPNGRYIIGKDIPVGTFDFTWVYGHGYLQKYKNDENTTLGNLTYDGGMIGNMKGYEKQCFHVKCEEGEMLVIGGNLIVGISRAKKIELDL